MIFGDAHIEIRVEAKFQSFLLDSSFRCLLVPWEQVDSPCEGSPPLLTAAVSLGGSSHAIGGRRAAMSRLHSVGMETMMPRWCKDAV